MASFVVALSGGCIAPSMGCVGENRRGRPDVRDIPKRLLGSLLFLVLGFMVGCGGGGSSSTGGPLSVSISPAGAVVSLGGTQQFTATVTNDPKNGGVTWTLTVNGAACSPSCGSLSLTTTASGTATTYTAPASSLSVVLTATSVTDATVIAQVPITVTGSTAVSVVPTTATVQLNNGVSTTGYTQQFAATVANDTSNKGVTWSLSQNGAACAPACGSVSPTSTADGVATTYTAPPTAPSSTAPVTLTATSVAFPGQTAWATITIEGGLTVSVTPTYVANVPEKGTQTFIATIANDTTNAGVTWTLTQNGKSCSPGCGTVSPTSTTSGVATTYTAPSSSTTVTLTATSVADKSVSSYATIIVQGITVTVAPTSGNIYEGQTADFVANVTNDVANGGVTWKLTENGSSCSPGCGTLSPTSTASGVTTTYTAPATVKTPAVLDITATSVTDTSQSDSATLNLYPPIGVSVSPATASVAIGSGRRTTFSATVANDPTDSGVNWTLTQSGKDCIPGCGNVSPTSTTSGQATTYFAPSAMPSSATVTLTATAVMDVSKTGSATVTLGSSSPAAKFSGSYAFAFNGSSSAGPVATAGSFTADSTGNITGIEDVNGPSGVVTAQPFTGTYTAQPGGTGGFTLTSAQGTPLGTFQFAFDASGKQAQFTETDSSGARGSGLMVRRTLSSFTPATLSGSYAFGVSGANARGARLALAGRFQANGKGGISAGLLDSNDAGNLSSGTPFNGSYSISSAGRGTLTAVTQNGTLHYAFYVASPGRLFLISTDPGATGAMTSGSALAQSSQMAGAFSDASLSGPAVIRFAGLSGTAGSKVAAGLVNFDGHGGLQYSIDENDGGKPLALSGKGSYTVQPTGRVTMTLDSLGSPLVSYLTARNQALVVGTGSGVSSGRLLAQAAGPFDNSSLSGSYILRTIAAPGASSPIEWGMITSAGQGQLDGSAAGLSGKGVRQPAGSFTETYAVSPSGRAALGNSFVVLYLVSPSRAVAINMTPGLTAPTLSEIVK